MGQPLPRARRSRRRDLPPDEAVQIAQKLVGNRMLMKAEPLPRYGKRTFRRYKAMLTLTERFERAYQAHLDEMVRVMRAYIEKNILKGPLEKAGPGKPLVSPAELDDLVQIIEDYHQAFVAGTVGSDALRPEDVERLIDAGILPEDLRHTFDPTAQILPPEALNVIEDAYRYGHVLGRARDAKARSEAHSITYEQFQRKAVPTIPLDEREKQAVAWVKHSAAKEIKGLGNRVGADFSTLAIEADASLRRRYMGIIRDTVEDNIKHRETWRQLASDLGHKTGDWSRDFKRIAATEKQKAMQEGQVSALVKRYGDPEDIRVAKQPNPDACPNCVRLHYTRGAGSPLRIFKLSTLVDNGSNVGKKQVNWQATVGPVHPWCGCEILHIPEGWGFDEDNNVVPETMLRSDWLEWDLRKSGKAEQEHAPLLSYKNAIPDVLTIRVGDPIMREEIEKVIAQSPPEIFDREVGITLITTDIPRVQNPLDERDFAYWSGNEIRIAQTLDPKRIARVLPHEIGHSLNVWLMGKLGSVPEVRQWHQELWAVSRAEGFVSKYAKKEPIENAAEVTMNYLYHRRRLMIRWPRQFAFVHKWYSPIWKKKNRNGR